MMNITKNTILSNLNTTSGFIHAMGIPTQISGTYKCAHNISDQKTQKNTHKT